jgi:hypothetical protein
VTITFLFKSEGYCLYLKSIPAGHRNRFRFEIMGVRPEYTLTFRNCNERSDPNRIQACQSRKSKGVRLVESHSSPGRGPPGTMRAVAIKGDGGRYIRDQARPAHGEVAPVLAKKL